MIIFVLMKQTVIRIALIVAALMATACSKESISPEDLFNAHVKVAQTTIKTRGSDYEDTVTSFPSVAVYRKSDIQGKSRFTASSGGRMVYDMFFLSIYFDSIDKMKVGDTLKPSRFLFTFPASSDSRATTHEYGGKITLAGKGDDYVILRFHQVSVSCIFGNYLTDGYLYCPLFEEFKIEE